MSLKLNSKRNEGLFLTNECIKPFNEHQVSCPICGSNTDWAISKNIGIIPARDDEDTVAYPVVPILCENCGYTAFVNPARKKEKAPPEKPIETEKMAFESTKETKEENKESISEEALELAKILQEIFNVMQDKD